MSDLRDDPAVKWCRENWPFLAIIGLTSLLAWLGAVH